MRRVRKTASPDADVLRRFRTEIMGIYKKFEEDLSSASKKYGFKINMWYSPSKIPQPNFRSGGFLFDVDQLYHDQDFRELMGQHYPAWDSTAGNGRSVSTTNAAAEDVLRRSVELRGGRPDVSYSVFNFKQDDADLRVRKSRHRRGGGF